MSNIEKKVIFNMCQVRGAKRRFAAAARPLADRPPHIMRTGSWYASIPIQHCTLCILRAYKFNIHLRLTTMLSIILR